MACGRGGAEDHDRWRVDAGDFRKRIEGFVKGSPKC